MAAYVDPAYCGWPQEEFSDRDEAQEVSVSKMLEHGSISFGRFAFETLEWERRSVFTHNKCQEELEKFKSPGLVAQKKAYFEEHYKRVRDLKAMQENQQTVLTLDYGGDGSISSQIGEDEIAVQIEKLGDGASNAIDAHSKEASVDVTLDRKHDVKGIKIRHVDLEPISSTLDSSREVSMEINQENSNRCALQAQHLDSGLTVLESLIRTEEIDQDDHIDFDDKGVSRNHDNSGSTVKQESNSGCDVHIHHVDRRPTGHISLTRTEGIEQSSCPLYTGSTLLESIIRKEEIEKHDHIDFDEKGISRLDDNPESAVKKANNSGCDATDVPIDYMDRQPTHHESLRRTEISEQHKLSSLDLKEISKKYDNLESDVWPELASGGIVLHPANPNTDKSDCSIVREKVKSYVRKEHRPVSKVKGPAASVRNDLKSETKNQTDIKLSRAPKYQFQKTVSKTKDSAGSSNMTSDRVSRYHKSTPVASHKPLTEVRSNPTIPRPFLFSTVRQSAVPDGTRDSAPRLRSKTPNGLATSLNQANDVRNTQDTSRKSTRTYSLKSKGSENKRGSEEVRERALFTSRTRKGSNIPEPPKTGIFKSVNLPARNHSHPRGGSEYRSSNALRKDKQKEVKLSSTDPSSLVKGRRPLTGAGMSRDGTKLRQELPQWR